MQKKMNDNQQSTTNGNSSSSRWNGSNFSLPVYALNGEVWRFVDSDSSRHFRQNQNQCRRRISPVFRVNVKCEPRKLWQFISLAAAERAAALFVRVKRVEFNLFFGWMIASTQNWNFISFLDISEEFPCAFCQFRFFASLLVLLYFKFILSFFVQRAYEKEFRREDRKRREFFAIFTCCDEEMKS